MKIENFKTSNECRKMLKNVVSIKSVENGIIVTV